MGKLPWIALELNVWVGKSIENEDELFSGASSHSFVVGPFRSLKGKKTDWEPEDWPPRKARVIVIIN